MKPDEFDTYLRMEEASEAMRNAALGNGPTPVDAFTEKPVYRPGGYVALLAALSLAAWIALAVGIYLLVRWLGWVAAPLAVVGAFAALTAAQR